MSTGSRHSRRAHALLAVLLAAGAGSCERARFDPAAVASHRMLAGIPQGFLLGAASSAHQIEGESADDWTDWERGRYPDGRPHVARGASTSRAAGSWQLWRQDVEALRGLDANAYRLGIEWSRLEPAEGEWNETAAARYREMLGALREAGIEPVVTLWHFTLPRWVAARGGWEWAGAPDAFASFARRAGRTFGDLVDVWCPLNEPNVYAAKGFLSAEWPPGVRDAGRAVRVMVALLKAHALATHALRAADTVDADGDGQSTRVGMAHNVRVFDAAGWNPLDGLAARYADRFYNRSIPEAVARGRIQVSIPWRASHDEPYEGLRGTLDWLGINYYTRDRLRGHLWGGSPMTSAPVPAERATDLGWEIYPEGLLVALHDMAGYGWPIMVTEIGLADRSGKRRPDFLRAHVYALDRARAEGVNVVGLMVWSLTDNFEWSHGYEGRFGLYSIDFEDPLLVRRPTAAVETFREAAAALPR